MALGPDLHIGEHPGDAVRHPDHVRHLRPARELTATATVGEQDCGDDAEVVVVSVIHGPAVATARDMNRGVRQEQGAAGGPVLVTVEPQHLNHAPRPGVDRVADLTGVLDADERVPVIVLVRADRDERAAEDLLLLVAQRRLAVEVVDLPSLPQRRVFLGGVTSLVERPQGLANRRLGHRHAGHVDDRLERPQLGRHGQSNVPKPLLALVIIVQAGKGLLVGPDLGGQTVDRRLLVVREDRA